jgi:3-oxoacyl-[acyl-carrier-protein] synthase II
VTRRRVAITGLGVVSPHGCDVGLMFDALMRGESAVRRMELDSKVGALECIRADPRTPWKTLSRAQLATSDRVSHSALVAADAALHDAGLDLASEDRARVGVSVGTSLGGAISQEAAYVEILEGHASRLSPFTLVKVMYTGPAAHICLAHHIEGPSITYTTTCSSSTVSIGEASRHIRHGMLM